MPFRVPSVPERDTSVPFTEFNTCKRTAGYLLHNLEQGSWEKSLRGYVVVEILLNYL